MALFFNQTFKFKKNKYENVLVTISSMCSEFFMLLFFYVEVIYYFRRLWQQWKKNGLLVLRPVVVFI